MFPIDARRACAETEEERRERTERLQDLKRTEEFTGSSSRVLSGLTKRLGWWGDYGGNLKYTYTGGDENDRTYNTPDALEFSKDYEINTFINLTDLTRTSKFYGRVRSTYTERKKNAATTRGNEWTQLEVDLLYYEKKIKVGSTETKFTLGRQSVSVGKGIAFSAAADGVIINTTVKRVDLTMFANKADRSPDDNDPGNLSPPSRGHTHRSYIGGQFTLNLPRISPYYYYVKTLDKSPLHIDPQSAQVHFYEPSFIGYGANGSITQRLSYFMEFIQAYGSTTSQSSREDTTIVHSRAYNYGFRYRFPGLGKFGVAGTGEWAFGSGDQDRQTTTNSTNGGNRAGNDEAFRPFGGVSLGYALAPTLVNLRAKHFGISSSPFGQVPLKPIFESFRSLSMTVDWYDFRRHVIPGPISDLAALADNRAGPKIGREINAQATWQIFSDMRLNIRWGKFIPSPDSYGLTNGAFDIIRGGVPEIYWRFQWTLDL